MFILDRDPIEWAEEHKIEVYPIACNQCSEEFIPSKPFITKEYVGLISEKHDCGKGHQSIIYVAKSALKNLELKELLDNLILKETTKLKLL